MLIRLVGWESVGHSNGGHQRNVVVEKRVFATTGKIVGECIRTEDAIARGATVSLQPGSSTHNRGTTPKNP